MQSDILRKKLNLIQCDGAPDEVDKYTDALCDHLAWLESRLDLMPTPTTPEATKCEKCDGFGLFWDPLEPGALEQNCRSCPACKGTGKSDPAFSPRQWQGGAPDLRPARASWMTVISRDGETEAIPFESEEDARTYFGPASAQWSEAYLCRVVIAPRASWMVQAPTEAKRPESVVWANETSPFTGAQVKGLLDENEKLRAERDVWSGKACEEEQAAGNGPCGACRFCLPKLLAAACAERDALIDKAREEEQAAGEGWRGMSKALTFARAERDELQKELANERARLIPEEERRKLEGDALQAEGEVFRHREYTQKLLSAVLNLCKEIDPNELDRKGTDLEWIESCRASVEKFSHSNLAKRAEAAESDAAKFKAALASLRESDSWGDKPLPEDDAIQAAHPLRTGLHDVYAEAARLVGAKRSKRALVDLVNWLLCSARNADAARLDERRERQRFERWYEEQRVKAEAADAALIAERGGWEAREAAVTNPLLNRLQEAAARIVELEKLVDCVRNNRDQHKQWLDDISAALHPHWKGEGHTHFPDQLAEIARDVVRVLDATKGKLERSERVVEAAREVRKGGALMKLYQSLDELVRKEPA
jgi:hypothetical protein